ncbi:MAG: autotransporter domain-containing protein [Phenylobacterium sp.]|uniref:autotransporter family protein n=1 Tax=Phenylobacterium sp. TaxID=1871053 RepID=UPI001B7B2D91|nr:autotransporter outer membrane beta-barrel domain-containing protein [Phenylobacterium sp.]MBP7815847.1 autotransporter domain-containing protein [Phenylobacterium sp.]MBP9755669.1 autotransporter domain-containing protein [Phenylobacterium sp.]
MSLRHLLLAAASPLCLVAGPAWAETAISTAVTTPVTTATAAGGARDDVKVTSAGSIKVTSGVALTLNSDNNVTHEGVITISDASDASGVAIVGGKTGEVKLSGSIVVDDTTEIKDTDTDGDMDGAFAVGSNRVGVRVTGPATFHGSITQAAGTVTVEGNDSAGVALESAIDGSLQTAGAISVIGDRSYGLHALGTVGGDVAVTGSVTAQGKDSVGVALDDNVGGKLSINSAIGASGFRSTTRGTDAVVAKLDADDLLIGGPAVRVRGDLFGGMLIGSSGSASAYGSAPGVLIGSDTRNVRLGVLGTGADAFGFMNKGAILGAGIYDGVAAVGVKFGGLGHTVSVEGGVWNSGSILATGVKAGATAFWMGAGASSANLTNAAVIKASTTATDANDIAAIRIDAGASLPYLANSGSISAVVSGSKASATAVLDASGSLRTLENINSIAATVTATDATIPVTGRAIALDLRANTAGVTLRQYANSDTAITPTITGDVLFGSGAGRLELLAGVLNGAVAFGSGADSLVINGGAKLTGALTDAGGGLTVDIVKGRLTDTSTATVNLTSLNLGAAGELVFTADPKAAKSTLFNVSGAATLATGSKIGLSFASKLEAPASFTLIKAGSLTTGTLDDSLLGDTPYLYKATLRVDAPTTSLVADVRRRTAAEAGMTASESAAYDAVFAAFDKDTAVRDALLGKTTQAGFQALYDQFLPDHAGGLFHTLAAASDAASRGPDADVSMSDEEGGLRAWTQEIGVMIKRDVDRSTAYDAGGFGIAAGIEAPNTALGAVGLQTSFLNVDVDEVGAVGSESLSGTVLSAGVYWRESLGQLTVGAGITGGYASLKSERVLSDSGFTRTASSDWNGATVAAHAHVNWNLEGDTFYARPQATLDYFLLKEGDRTETGGGEAVNLAIEERSSSQIAAFAGVSIGARFGLKGDFRWGPELTAGWRQVSGDGADATTARFVSGGSAFTIAAPELSGGGAVVRLALRGQSDYVDFALEGGGEVRDDYEAYDARIVARMVF